MIHRICKSCLICLAFFTLCQTSFAQMFFEADALYYGRGDNSGKKIVTGPESVGLGKGGYDGTAGYRLTIGGSVAEYDIDGSLMQLDTWNGSSQGQFTNLISFDGDTIPADPMGINSLASFTSLARAASFVDMADNETTESERIVSYFDPVTMVDTPLTYSSFNKSNLTQYEINIGTRRETNWWRFAIGYRHVDFSERSGLTLNGVFDAPDINPAMPDDPNNGLSGGALASTGLAGTGGFMAIDTTMMVPADILSYQVQGVANNRLDGAQITSAVRLFDGEWITIEAIGKAGIYRNGVSGAVQETVVGSGNSSALYQQTLRDNDATAAFAGNLGVKGTISLTDYINVILGYDVLFLGGVALSADQTDGLSQDLFGNNVYKIQNKGNVVAHGSNVGLEILW